MTTDQTSPDATVIAAKEVKVVAKPWGEEHWLAHTDRYAAKLLIIRKGWRLSLQYHERKHETQYVQSGRVRYTLGDRELIAEPGTTIILPPGAIHRMEALEDACIFEVSTPDLEDIVRLEDELRPQGDERRMTRTAFACIPSLHLGRPYCPSPAHGRGDSGEGHA